MTKSELIAKLAGRYPQLVARNAEFAVNAIFEAMTTSLVKGHLACRRWRFRVTDVRQKISRLSVPLLLRGPDYPALRKTRDPANVGWRLALKAT